jgi:hypothetical protein
MASTKKLALLFLVLTLAIIVGIIGVSFVQPAQYNNGINTDQTQANDPSLSNGETITAMDLPLPEYSAVGSLAGVIACLAAVFVVYQKKKK